jgi:hypothetical protein
MGEAPSSEAFAEAAGAARRIAEHKPEQLGVGIGQRALDESHTASGIAEASSSRAKARRPLLCRPAMASVFCSD